MARNLFENFGLYDDIDTVNSQWKLVDKKSVPDMDGFMTEYAWYTDGEKHIFMFGDTDITEPSEEYADWVAESEQTAKEWFDSYTGFSDNDEDDVNPFSFTDEDDDYFEEKLHNSSKDFLNKGFNRVYRSSTDSVNKSLKDITTG